jgi:Xaa-Pro dipeptidase
VTAGCRIIKSPAEIALMQQANDITLQAIGTTIKSLEEGHRRQLEGCAVDIRDHIADRQGLFDELGSLGP